VRTESVPGQRIRISRVTRDPRADSSGPVPPDPTLSGAYVASSRKNDLFVLAAAFVASRPHRRLALHLTGPGQDCSRS
jgi:hypothetical protein